MSKYRLAMFTPDKVTLPDLTWYSGFNFSYGENVVGYGVVTVDGNVKEAKSWTPYSTLEMWRSVEGRTYLEGDRLWYLLDIEDLIDEAGRHLTNLIFADANYLLESRHILYAADSSQAAKTDYADDMLKDLVRENLGSSATDTTRNASTWLTVAADKGQAPSITKGFSNRPMLTVMQEIAAQSREAGTYLAFDCVRTSAGVSEFRTYCGQRGVNRGTASAAPLYLSWRQGNLKQPAMKLARMGRPNFIRAGGTGTTSDRIYEDAYESNLMALTRYENFADCRNTGNDTASVYSEALAALQLQQPATLFSGYIAENQDFRYGYDIGFGDRFVVNYGGYTFNSHLRSVHISMNETGQETLELAVKNED